MSTLALCNHAPCRMSSKQENFSLLSKFFSAFPAQLKYYLILATLLVLASLLVAPAKVYSQTTGAPVVATGTLEVLTADGLQGQVSMSYLLHTDNDGPVYELLFTTSPPPADLVNGQRVTVTGTAEGNRLSVETLKLLTPDAKLPVTGTTADNTLSVETLALPAADANLAVNGDRRAVFILIDLLNVKASTRYTRDQVATAMYALNMNGVPAPAGTRSVRGLYQAASLGQVNFVPDSNNDGVPDVFGPFTINYSYTGTCDYLYWTQAAEAAVQQAGIDLSRYQHRVFVLPRYSDIPACSWTGLANVGCDLSFCRTGIAYAESPMVFAHELGHNLGMGHGGTDPENDGTINNAYGDYSDTMGNSQSWHLFNAAHIDQMQWYGNYINGIVTITASGTYDISVLDATLPPNPLPNPRIIRLQRPNNQGYYYLSYRQPTGYDNTLTTLYTQGVNIHGYPGSGPSTTAFIKSLTDGTTFSDSAAK